MPAIDHIHAVRADLARLKDRESRISGYSTHHAAELRDALSEAESLARRKGLSVATLGLIALIGIFSPLAAISRVLRYVEAQETIAPQREAA